MRTQDILMTCGSVISIVAATPALPQQGQPGQNEPARQPGQTTTTQPGQTQPGRTTSNIGQFNLRDLEGVWRVDVNVNPQIFKAQKSTTSTSTPGIDTGKDKDLDRDQPGQDRTPPGQSGGLSSSSTSSFSGFAESDLIFNDRVVRQEIVIPDMKVQGASSSGVSGGAIGQPPSTTTTGRSGSDIFRGMTLISFDEQNRKYHIAFLDNQHGEIKHCTGTYDPSQNRIVFNSMASTSGTSTLRTSSGSGLPENVKVVLEVLSPDSHRVTMYQPSSSSTTSTPTTPSTRTDPTRPPTTPPGQTGGQPGQPGQPSTIAMGDSEGTVIYRATYNKATGADATKARDLLKEDDRRTTRLDIDR